MRTWKQRRSLDVVWHLAGKPKAYRLCGGKAASSVALQRLRHVGKLGASTSRLNRHLHDDQEAQARISFLNRQRVVF